jgi:PIN domain nuclease of toxin-antitoxin system
MTLLLDTHVVIWWLEDSTQLAESAREAISDPDNDVLISVASAWEISIKRSLGKLSTPDDLEEAVPLNGFEWLDIRPRHAIAVEHLLFIHRDPFDRLLIAQAIVEDATIVTRDPNIAKYAVTLLEA